MSTKLPARTGGTGEGVTTSREMPAPTTVDSATERAAAAYLVAGLSSPDAGPSPAHFVPLGEFLKRA